MAKKAAPAKGKKPANKKKGVTATITPISPSSSTTSAATTSTKASKSSKASKGSKKKQKEVEEKPLSKRQAKKQAKKEAKVAKKNAKEDEKADKKNEKFRNAQPVEIEKLGKEPGKVYCPHCGVTAMTNTHKPGGCCSCIGSLLINLLCIFNPIPMAGFSNITPRRVKHRCNSCNELLGIKPRMGSCKPTRRTTERLNAET